MMVRGLLAMAIGAALMLALIGMGWARDYGQWDRSSPVVAWYRGLMQPDNPAVSCCGEADSYWADGFEATSGGEYVAIVTDERSDVPLGRHHVPPSTRIVVPNRKIKYDQGNPTGHGVIFLSAGNVVYCFVPPGGV